MSLLLIDGGGLEDERVYQRVLCECQGREGAGKPCDGRLHAPGVGASAAIKPAFFSSAHSSSGIGSSTSRTFSSTSATDRAPGITEAIAGWARMNWSAA